MHNSLVRIFSVLAVVVSALFFVDCSGHGSGLVKEFPYVSAPDNRTSVSAQVYLQYHFWDKFDFRDTTLVSRMDSVAMIKAVSKYVSLVGPLNPKPISQMLRKASASRTMLDYISGFMEEVTHNPNSPLRSDELFIPLLKCRLDSGFYDEAERAVMEYDLRKASSNRIGHQANDFLFYTLRGGKSSLYKIESEYIIIFINNPGCPMCMDIIKALKEDEYINILIENHRLKVLAIYPDEDLTEFRKHLSDMDSRWINAYDKGCQIDAGNLYNLDAIPSLYLLDASKRVLIKDSTSVDELSFVLRRMDDM